MHNITVSGLDNRICSDLKVEAKKSAQGKDYKTCSFQVACGNGWYKDAAGKFQQRQADFVNVRTSNPYIVEKLEKKAAKGMNITLTGTFHTWSKKLDNGTYSNGSYIEISNGDLCEVFEVVKNNNGTTATEEVEVPSAEDVQNAGNEMDIDISADDLPF